VRFVILGGGCYGSFYAKQLLLARDAGAIQLDEIIVADRDVNCQARRDVPTDASLTFDTRDWDAFFDGYFENLDPACDDQIVPPPFTPHLALRWLLRRLPEARPDIRWEIEPFRAMPNMPFQHQSEGGPLVVSHADWICPVHCIEPSRCPHTKGPRFWDVAETVERFRESLGQLDQPITQVHLFQCLHNTYGVGTYPSAAVLRARTQIEAAVSGTFGVHRFLIGTVSHCHGALHLMRAAHGMESVSTSGLHL
jgi:hypothetical protein